MDTFCAFHDYEFVYGEKFYRCCIKNQQIPENHKLNIIGQHKDGMSNKDVLCVEFNGCTVTKVPQGLTKIFPNLKILDIDGSKLKKISKNDLVEYKNCEKLLFGRNELEFLPDDLFEDFINLEYIAFFNNKLKFIMPSILDGLKKLKYVGFSGNVNYKKCYSIYPEYSPNATLEEIKVELREKFFPHLMQFEEYLTSKNGLEQENCKLKMSEMKLKQQIQQFEYSEIQLKNDLKREKIKYANVALKLQKGIFVDISAFIQDETTKDFRIQIDDREFPVHKFLFSARSPTLAEILKNNPEVENLNLVDISVEIFEIILKFLYTDELPGDDGTNFLQLFAAAGKLKIKELKDFAANKLNDLIDENNAIEVLKLSNKYEHDELRQKSFNELKKMYPKYELKEKWITKIEIVVKIIEQFKKNEEAIRKLEEELENIEIN